MQEVFSLPVVIVIIDLLGLPDVVAKLLYSETAHIDRGLGPGNQHYHR